jgi:phage terminase Nu1 subunit (DNA packaging protein)
MPPQKELTYTVSTLARLVREDQAQVSRWKAEGMPFDRNGRITAAAAWAWIRTHERRERKRLSRSEADERRAAAEAELAELKLARERADVVPAAAVLAAAEDEAARVRGVLTQLHTEFAPLVAARLTCGLRDASAVLREISDGVCARLAAQDDTEQESAA